MGKGQTLSGGHYLFDLDADPYEEVNLLEEASYAETLDLLTQKAESWIDKIGDTDIPTSSKKKTAWRNYGGVVPWVDDETTFKDSSVKFSFDEAPHIVLFLVDDWGYNDIGYQSTYLNWTTPNIDALANDGIKLTNYYSHSLCTPSRAALLTGRYSIRSGLAVEREGGELPLTETLLSEDLQASNYRTYLIGKWHLGMSSYARTPTHRGFDYFYGYYGGFIDYYSKTYSGYLDLHENEDLVSDPDELSEDLHTAYLFESKAESIIKDHATNYPDRPMFLYYASQLVHADWAAPQRFLDRCDDGIASNDQKTYCAMNLLLDEVVGNLTCTLQEYGMTDNLLFILASDNGGISAMPGDTYPFRGSKGSYFRGGVSVPALVSGSAVPRARRGTTYSGQLHVTDWYPTIMYHATGNAWSGNDGIEMDGANMWIPLLTGASSNHPEIVHWMDDSGNCSYQYQMKKLFITTDSPNTYSDPEYVILGDNAPNNAYSLCENPNIISDYLNSVSSTTTSSTTTSTDDTNASFTNYDNLSIQSSTMKSVIVGLLVVVALITVFTFAARTVRKLIDIRNSRNEQNRRLKKVSDANGYGAVRMFPTVNAAEDI